MIRYRNDERFGPVVDTSPAEHLALARWLTDEIGHQFTVLLDALAFVDAAAHRREPPGEWSSDGYEVRFGPETLTIRDLGDETGAPASTYPIDEARKAIEEYAAFLIGLPDRGNEVREFRPDLPAWQAGLLWWEQYREERHPYRGRLGLPESGPA